jgi:hypothetical protein
MTDEIANTGTGARSYVGPLADVVKRGINTLIWAGDTGKFTITVTIGRGTNSTIF